MNKRYRFVCLPQPGLLYKPFSQCSESFCFSSSNLSSSKPLVFGPKQVCLHHPLCLEGQLTDACQSSPAGPGWCSWPEESGCVQLQTCTLQREQAHPGTGLLQELCLKGLQPSWLVFSESCPWRPSTQPVLLCRRNKRQTNTEKNVYFWKEGVKTTLYLLSFAVSMVNLYWLRVLKAAGLFTLSVSGTFGFVFGFPLGLSGTTGAFFEMADLRVAETVLVGGRWEKNPAGRLVLALITGAGFWDTDLDLTSATDRDLFFLDTFSSLWPSDLGTADCRAPTVLLDFQIEPILDWTILPLYIPGADLDDGAADGGFLMSTACSWPHVGRWTSGAVAFTPLCTVITVLWAAPNTGFESTCLDFAGRACFLVVISFLFPCSWNGTTELFPPLMSDFGPGAGKVFSLFPWNGEHTLNQAGPQSFYFSVNSQLTLLLVSFLLEVAVLSIVLTT